MRSPRLAALVIAALTTGCTATPTAAPPDTASRAGATSASPSPAGPTATTSGSSTPSRPTARRLTVVAGGDVLLHQTTWRQADADDGRVGDGRLDFGPQLAGVGWLVSRADLALCHMETPLARTGGPYAGYPSFSGPPQIAPALADLGFDACSQASNHTFDQGVAGAARTAATLAKAGITSYGVRSGDHPGNPTLVTVRTASGPVRVALMSYTYGFNGPVPAGGTHVAEVVSAARVRADAAKARAKGAEIVIASVHWGTEYVHTPNAMQRALAPQLAAIRDLDLVVGHHAHVVLPFARINGTWVAYGLGNMLATHGTDISDNQEGVLAEFTFTAAGDRRWEISRAAYQPILVDRTGGGVRIVSLPQDLGGASTDALRARYRLAERRTRQVVTSLSAPVVELTSR